MVTIFRILAVEVEPKLSIHMISVNRATKFPMKARHTAAKQAFLKAKMQESETYMSTLRNLGEK